MDTPKNISLFPNQSKPRLTCAGRQIQPDVDVAVEEARGHLEASRDVTSESSPP